MAKKRSVKQPRVPYPTHIKLIAGLFIVLMFAIVFYVGSVTHTGLAVSELNQPLDSIIINENLEINKQFEILDIQKSPNSVLNVNVNSNLPINIFAEIDDCPYWKNGKDKNNQILYSVNNIKEGDFKIGNPDEKTVQQIDLYKTNNLCLILINRQHPKIIDVNIQISEEDVDKWRII